MKKKIPEDYVRPKGLVNNFRGGGGGTKREGGGGM